VYPRVPPCRTSERSIETTKRGLERPLRPELTPTAEQNRPLGRGNELRDQCVLCFNSDRRLARISRFVVSRRCHLSAFQSFVGNPPSDDWTTGRVVGALDRNTSIVFDARPNLINHCSRRTNSIARRAPAIALRSSTAPSLRTRAIRALGRWRSRSIVELDAIGRHARPLQVRDRVRCRHPSRETQCASLYDELAYLCE